MKMFKFIIATLVCLTAFIAFNITLEARTNELRTTLASCTYDVSTSKKNCVVTIEFQYKKYSNGQYSKVGSGPTYDRTAFYVTKWNDKCVKSLDLNMSKFEKAFAKRNGYKVSDPYVDIIASIKKKKLCPFFYRCRKNGKNTYGWAPGASYASQRKSCENKGGKFRKYDRSEKDFSNIDAAKTNVGNDKQEAAADNRNNKEKETEAIKKKIGLLSKIEFSDNIGSCNQLLSPKVIKQLDYIYLIIKIATPILLLVLGMTDFLKALSSNDDDALIKAGKKFGVRAAVALVVFLLPDLVEFILNATGISDGTCGIG